MSQIASHNNNLEEVGAAANRKVCTSIFSVEMFLLALNTCTHTWTYNGTPENTHSFITVQLI
jgi:hypothetical protein